MQLELAHMVVMSLAGALLIGGPIFVLKSGSKGKGKRKPAARTPATRPSPALSSRKATRAELPPAHSNRRQPDQPPVREPGPVAPALPLTITDELGSNAEEYPLPSGNKPPSPAQKTVHRDASRPGRSDEGGSIPPKTEASQKREDHNPPAHVEAKPDSLPLPTMALHPGTPTVIATPERATTAAESESARLTVQLAEEYLEMMAYQLAGECAYEVLRDPGITGETRARAEHVTDMLSGLA